MNLDYKGLTLVEIILSILLFSIVVLGLMSIYLPSQRFSQSTNSKAVLQSELGYVLDHITKNIVQGIGDVNIPAVSIGEDGSGLDIRINRNNPLSGSNYSDVTSLTYSKVGDELIFSSEGSTESLLPSLTILDNPNNDPIFTLVGENLVTIELTARYKTQTLTMYSAAHPRLMSNK